MPRSGARLLSVEETALGLGVSPRTIRRWLQEQRLIGYKIGGTWGVWWSGSTQALSVLPSTAPSARQLPVQARRAPSAVAIRTRLRQVGARLITVGNHAAGAQRRRGTVFLTWRRGRSLQIVLALGRQSPRDGWAPHALGTALPFWWRERARWQSIVPLLRHYEQVRGWCHPHLLQIEGVDAVILAELTQLEANLETLTLESPG